MILVRNDTEFGNSMPLHHSKIDNVLGRYVSHKKKCDREDFTAHTHEHLWFRKEKKKTTKDNVCFAFLLLFLKEMSLEWIEENHVFLIHEVNYKKS